MAREELPKSDLNICPDEPYVAGESEYRIHELLGSEGRRAIATWLAAIKPELLAEIRRQFNDEVAYQRFTDGGKHLWAGEFGALLSVTFSLTSVGTVVKVEEGLTGKILNLSEAFGVEW